MPKARRMNILLDEEDRRAEVARLDAVLVPERVAELVRRLEAIEGTLARLERKLDVLREAPDG